MDPWMSIPAAAVVVGDEIYAGGLWIKVTERLLSTPMPGKITFHIATDPPRAIHCGANVKVSVKRG